jgi:hypothetical protein
VRFVDEVGPFTDVPDAAATKLLEPNTMLPGYEATKKLPT